MIFTQVTIDNLYCFNRTAVDFTFARKLKHSTIEAEHLQGAENFKYKRACILSGANASGKTAFGRVLCGVQNFLAYGDLVEFLREGIADTKRPATITAEFVAMNHETQRYVLHVIHVSFAKVGRTVNLQNINYAATPITANDTNVSSRRRLNALADGKMSPRQVDTVLTIDYHAETQGTMVNKRLLREQLEKHEVIGWFYTLSEHHQENTSGDRIMLLSASELQQFLQAFDHSIAKVMTLQSEDTQTEGFKVLFNNGDSVHILGEDSKLSAPDRLSKGTHEAIHMATAYAMISSGFGSNVYYIDEKMAYCHSEMEQTILNLLLEKLPPDNQLFYTTHNYDIIDMNLPIHAYYIFSKQEGSTEIIDIGKRFKKNDRGLLNYVKNDAFRTLPDTSAIDELLYQ